MFLLLLNLEIIIKIIVYTYNNRQLLENDNI